MKWIAQRVAAPGRQVMTMARTDRCQAICNAMPRMFRRFSCDNKARHQAHGVNVCSTHLRQLARWEAEGRDVPDMMEFWWNIPRKDGETP